ncbi:glycosyltransferase family 4 protein [Paenibacillus sp. GCM10023250]|uniref:glycosyltransferase family 4 protein n=1 Tax=Paenibacillus sp. GCM10023250 TaxID=3252648 RepID=UPI003606D8E4
MKQTKPKLLLFSHICSPQYVTGAEKLLLFMIRELLPAYACTLVVPNEGVIAGHARKLGVPVIVQDIPLVVSLYLALPHMQAELAAMLREPAWGELLRLLLREQPQAVLVNTCVHPLPAIAGKALGIPVVWSAMETICETPLTAASAALIEAHADFVLGISETTLAPLRTPGLLPKTMLIPPSWHLEELQPEDWARHRTDRRRQLGFAEHERVVGYISSSIFEGKGLEHFMQMAIRTAAVHPHARYLIVGNPVDAPYFERCLGIARDAGVLERFRWLRFEEQVATVYPAMDLLVVPSLMAEGFGMTALEGMACGKPVVVYGSGGLAEIGQATGNAAYVAPTGDYVGLANLVSSLLADEALLQAVGARNVRGAHAVYGIAAYRERLRRFADLLKQRAPQLPRTVKGSGPAIYLLERAGVLRPFRTMAAFAAVGYRPEDVRLVPDAFIAGLPHGAPIGDAPRTARRSRKLRRSRRGQRGRRKGGAKLRRGRRAGKARRGKPAAGRRKRRRAS